ncbi:phage tail fiber protein [Castellaniella sp.]|uniref:phage tail fiber domain-containing protein n=1 Tax=Castellaniella sp. TaxID=1955812 RepID=UPI002AFFD955|nr:phage tail fiber protein [Castellaniella sp.]
MALSFVEYTGTGSLRNFAVPFPYLEREHVFVTVNGSPVVFSWLNASTVQTRTAPSSGAKVKVYRSTPKERPVVTFYNDQTMDVEHFNDGLRQALYVVQEMEDGGGGTIVTTIIEHLYGSWFYDLTVSLPYTPYGGEVLFVHPVVRKLTVPSGWSGSRATALVAPSQRAQTFSIYRDSVVIGSISFAVGSSSGVFSGSAVTIPEGSNLRIICTSEPDNLFRDVGLTLRLVGADA